MTAPHRLTQAERIASLEARMEALEKAQGKHAEAVETQLTTLVTKVTELTSFKDKGAGAFWLATALSGTGILAIVMKISEWWASISSTGVPN